MGGSAAPGSCVVAEELASGVRKTEESTRVASPHQRQRYNDVQHPAIHLLRQLSGGIPLRKGKGRGFLIKLDVAAGLQVRRSWNERPNYPRHLRP